MTAKTMHPSEAALRAALTDLASRWERMAATLTAGHPTELFGEFTETQQRQAAGAHIYRTTASDLLDVLRTGRTPHPLMTDTELEQHGTREEAAS